MRDKLNDNPKAQVAVVAVLLVAAAIFVTSSMGGGGEESESTTTSAESTTTSAEVATPEGSAAVTATVTTTGIPVEGASASIAEVPQVPAPPLPQALKRAFAKNRTVVLLIAKKGGVDDGLATVAAISGLASMKGVSMFVVPVDRVARYAAITQGVELNRVPALVVLRPKKLDNGSPTASVSYGYQSPQSVVQAVVDARYRGQTLDYHP
jgi:hypothetical protein